MSIFYTITFTAAILLILYGTLNIKNKRRKKGLVPIVIAGIILIVPLFLILSNLYKANNICLTAITPPHFRTNILTNTCDFFPGYHCLIEEPWYYEEGCDISLEEKLNILKKEDYWGDKEISWYGKIIENCADYCKNYDEISLCKNEEDFCNKLSRI